MESSTCNISDLRSPAKLNLNLTIRGSLSPPKNTNIGFCLNKGIERTSDLRASAVRATVFAAKVLPVVVVGVVAAVRSSVARTWIGHDDCWQLGAASDFILTILGQCDDTLKTDLITLSL